MILGIDRLKFVLNRLHENLWIKPLMTCLISVAVVFVARVADNTGLRDIAPDVSLESIETLLSIMASSMLVISTFAVASMVTAYASASSTATPRSFKLVITDDVSQNALSIFIAAFIFSVVAIIAVTNNLYQTAGRFILFVVTISIFTIVVVAFIRWVDRIARLGRLSETIDMVEQVTTKELLRRRVTPTLRAASLQQSLSEGQPVFASTVGYVQRIDIASLQAFATNEYCRVVVAALPGTFVDPSRPVAYIRDQRSPVESLSVRQAFIIGGERLFEDDPRFGLTVLSEIAGRSLSPAVNDPGTAIDIIGTLVRIFTLCSKAEESSKPSEPVYDRVEVPEILVSDLFDDAFTAIARDGAGIIEVAIRLQKALHSLASLGDTDVREAAIHHAQMALARSEKVLMLPEEIDIIRGLVQLTANRNNYSPHSG